jgi:type I restriction enzyme R subunit
MGREFTEVEKPFLDQLESIGWEVIRLDDKTKHDPTKSFRENFREIILENKFREAIRNINPWIEDDQITQVLDKIQSFTPKSISEVNQEFTQLLLEGIVLDENRKTGEKSPTVHLIDFKKPKNNIFTAINQFKVNIPATEKHIIPDIVLFINGIPMIVVDNSKYYILNIENIINRKIELNSCKRISKEDYINLVVNKCKPRILLKIRLYKKSITYTYR